MMRVIDKSLDARALKQLEAWQKELDSLPSYGQRVARGKEDFKRYNVTSNQTFRRVRKTLKDMCPGVGRCMYCGHSTADEIDHVRPKDLFPEYVFAWGNYVYCCGACNGMKLAYWAVFALNGAEIDLTRPRAKPADAPQQMGAPLFIDPRYEDPTLFLALDLLGTFLILPRRGLTAKDRRRAEYTIERLGLSVREDLTVARANHYSLYRARVKEYVQWRDDGVPPSQLNQLSGLLRTMDHPFVWFEMKRQRERILELSELFRVVPEALDW
jgi:uncharacterized protein (TIGR02646 family)